MTKLLIAKSTEKNNKAITAIGFNHWERYKFLLLTYPFDVHVSRANILLF